MRGKAKVLGLIIILTLFCNICYPSIGRDIDSEESKDIFQDSDVFDSKIKSLMQLGHFPSISACFLNKSSIMSYRSYGYSKTYKKIAPGLDTIYLTGSISKSVTALAILQLYEQGLFNLTDDVSNYLDFDVRNPYYPNEKITFHMLLSHQASFKKQDIVQLFHMLFVALFKTNDYPYPIIKQLILGKTALPRSVIWEKIPPGHRYYYSCLDYILLEHIVEKLSNRSFEKYCRDNIFIPLDMNNTAFAVEDLNEELLATPYFHLIGRLYFPIPQFSGEGIAGVGGLRSSVADLSNYLMMHMNNGSYKNKRILNESTMRLMHSIKYPIEGYDGHSDQRYGYGWETRLNWVEDDSFSGHTGNTPGGSSIMLMSNSQDVGVIIFTNKQAWFLIRPIPLLCWDRIIYLFMTKSLEYS